jgi:ParB/RepB/Spo0J family partition protein
MDNDKQHFVDLNPAEIQIVSDHGRRTESRKGIDALAHSISLYGLLHPPVVQRDKNGGIVLVAGARRLHAAREAGFQKVTCLVKHGCSGLTSLAENLHREDLDPIDKADAFYRTICEIGATQKAFAQIIGKSEASVSATLSLRNLRPEIAARHLRDGILSERQLLQIYRMGSLEEQERAYERALKKKQSKEPRKQPTIPDLIARKTGSLTKTFEKIDLARVSPAELTETCIRLFSAVGQLAASSARLPNLDSKAMSEIIQAGSLSLQQTVERLDLSNVNTTDLNKISERLLSTLTCLLESQSNKKSFDPAETASVLKNLVFVLARRCTDAKTLLSFCAAIREIERSVRKTCSARFSALNFLRRIAGWI